MLKLSISFSLKHFFISGAISTQVASALLRRFPEMPIDSSLYKRRYPKKYPRNIQKDIQKFPRTSSDGLLSKSA